MDKKCNQYFIQFGTTNEYVEEHFTWFSEHSVGHFSVSTVGEADDKTGFYHVVFNDDFTLESYKNKFENVNGESLFPDSYQLFEWDYDNWVNSQGPQEFLKWWENK